MDLSVPYTGKWPNNVCLPDYVSDDEEDVMLGDLLMLCWVTAGPFPVPEEAEVV